MAFGERKGDAIPVLVEAADGPVVVWHTPDEYAALAGPEPELAALMLGPLADDDCECEAACSCD